MVVPSAQFIEAAAAAAQNRERDFLLKELQELRTSGAESAPELASLPEDCTSFEKGYLIGVETARTLLALMPRAVLNDVSI